MRGRIEVAEAAAEEFDQVRAILSDERHWLVGPALVAAWGERAI